ncbi:rhodanese-like domain-containing protein [Patescibacteria group bacterium]
MRNTIILSSLMLLLLFGFYKAEERSVFGPSESGNGEILGESVPVENIDNDITKAIRKQKNDNVVILDVRTTQEYEEEHVVGAVNWDVERIKKDEFPEIPKDFEIYIYCRSGNRADQALILMENEGFESVVNIGGLRDWKFMGGKTTLDN